MIRLDSMLRAINIIRGRHQRLNDIRTSFSTQVADLNTTISQRDSDVAKLRGGISEREEALSQREKDVVRLTEAISQRDQALSEQVAANCKP